jgi:hypothetical protein
MPSKIFSESRTVISIVVFAFGLMTGCRQSKPVSGSGDEWLSWTPNEKRFFVMGFVDGSGSGSVEACVKMDDLTVVNDRKPEDGLLDTPSARCRNAYGKFSKVRITGSGPRGAREDVSAYTNVLDDFYRYPECRAMPYSILLTHLDDNEFKSGEDLYKFVRSGPGWGSFSVDGIERCLPGYQALTPPTKQ